MILGKLREKTAALHLAIEESTLLRHFKEKTITLSTYSTILHKFYGYYVPLEKALERHDNISAYLPDYRTRTKVPLLSQDLESLEKEKGGIPLEICPEIPSLATLSHAFGCLYVIEGSTLGGRIITKIVQDQFGIDVDSGGMYFHGYGPETGEKWKVFCQSLTDYALLTQEEDHIIEGANQTFQTLKNWLEQY